MSNKVTINSKDYTFKNIDFNGICELEDLGLSIDGIKKGKMNACRALLAYHGNMTSDEAGNEIMAHLKNGGGFDDFAPMIDNLVNSVFFQAIRQPDEAPKTTTGEEPSQA